jgi:maleate isomerase
MDPMPDWTHRLGFVVPSWNTVVEYEMVRMLPPGVSAHFSRIEHTDDSPASLQRMADEFPRHVELLAHAHVHTVCYACTGASLFHGRAGDLEDLIRLNAVSKPQVISTAAALVEAAQCCGLHRVAVAAPYEKWLLDCLIQYLEDAGLRVIKAVGLDQQANVLHPPQAALELAERAWVPSADGLVLSCGNFRTLELLADIEQSIRKPMITSNTAALWCALTRARWRGQIPNAGELLSGARALPLPGG